MIRKVFRWMAILTLGFVLVGCKTTDVFVKTPPMVDDGFLRNYAVPSPPGDAQLYSELTPDEKEKQWIDYTSDLLIIIGRHQADKSGIRAWKSGVLKAYEEYRKATGNADKEQPPGEAQ